MIKGKSEVFLFFVFGESDHSITLPISTVNYVLNTCVLKIDRVHSTPSILVEPYYEPYKTLTEHVEREIENILVNPCKKISANKSN